MRRTTANRKRLILARGGSLLAAIFLATQCGLEAAAQDTLPSFEELMGRPPAAQGIPPAATPNTTEGTVSRPRGFDSPQERSTPGASRAEQPYIPPAGGTPLRPGNDFIPADNWSPPRGPARSIWPQRSEQQNEGVRGTPISQTRTLPEYHVERDVEPRSDEVNWASHSTSVADLLFESAGAMQHGVEYLTTVEEQSAYLDLIDKAAEQKRNLRLIPETTPAQQEAIWQEAFYRFQSVRRRAWQNGQLRNGAAVAGSRPVDPFRSATDDQSVALKLDDKSYRLEDDMLRFPQHFVGRPIVLKGTFHPKTEETISDKVESDPANGFATEPSLTPARQVKLRRGTLTSIGTDKQIAVIHTPGLLLAGAAMRETRAVSRPIDVLVKGWYVKNWNGVPLVYADSVREFDEFPHKGLIQAKAIDRTSVRSEENWLYFETLRQLETAPAGQQQLLADATVQNRLKTLMQEIEKDALAKVARLKKQLGSGQLTQAEHDRQTLALKRQLAHRVRMYKENLEHPEDFKSYVDVFTNHDWWQGQLVTFRGHVRHVVSYPGDELLYGGRMLHELWLFTDDSQHNPAVIVTPNLPADFPTEADTIDQVTVTGCVFKQYVYTGQDSKRIAPLVLAGKVHWNPSDDQVRSLVADGHLRPDSAVAAAARTRPQDRTSETVVVVLSLFVIVLLMVLWGRAQREERDRVRLRRRVTEVPQLQTELAGAYVDPLASETDSIIDRYAGGR